MSLFPSDEMLVVCSHMMQIASRYLASRVPLYDCLQQFHVPQA